MKKIKDKDKDKDVQIFLPQSILLKVLGLAHGGVFPSNDFKSCLMVCRHWKQVLLPKSFRSLLFQSSNDSESSQLIKNFILCQEYNEQLQEIVIHSMSSIDGICRILQSLTTPFFCKLTNSLYHPPLTSLTITGSTMEDKEIDLVTDIIRIYNITDLTLKGVSLTDISLMTLSKALKAQQFNSLVRLNLSNNHLSKKSLEFLFQILVETHQNNVKEQNQTNSRNNFYHSSNINSGGDLGRSFNFLTDIENGVSTISLATVSSTQTNYSFVSNSHGILTVSSEAKSIESQRKLQNKPKRKEYLASLDISNNAKIGLECTDLINNLLIGLTELCDLNISNAALYSDGLQSLLSFMKLSRSIRSLNISSNNIRGVEDIGPLILENKLTSLDISDNKLSIEGMKSLCLAITATCSMPEGSHLRELYLRRTALSFQEALILRNLIFQTQSLVTLDFSSNQLDKDSIGVLVEALSFNKSIKDLNLSFNILGPAGTEILSQMIKSNRTIQRLHLHCVSMKKEGVAYLVDALTLNTTISTLYLSNNEIKNTGCILFSKLFTKNQSLNFVDFSYNSIKDKGVNELFKSLNDHHKYLKYDLSGNNFKNKESCRIM